MFNATWIFADPIVADRLTKYLPEPRVRLRCHRGAPSGSQRCVPKPDHLRCEISQRDVSQGRNTICERGKDVKTKLRLVNLARTRSKSHSCPQPVPRVFLEPHTTGAGVEPSPPRSICFDRREPPPSVSLGQKRLRCRHHLPTGKAVACLPFPRWEMSSTSKLSTASHQGFLPPCVVLQVKTISA
jgi:hypothetical protein